MIRGRFDRSDRPIVDVLLTLPRLGLGPTAVSFLLDTGADRTLLVPQDAGRLGIYDNLAFVGVPSVGMAGMTGATIRVFVDRCGVYLRA